MMPSAVSGVVDYICRQYESVCTKLNETFDMMVLENHPDDDVTQIPIGLKEDSDKLEDTLQVKSHPDFLEKEKGQRVGYYRRKEKIVPCPCDLCELSRKAGCGGGYKKEGDPCLCLLCAASDKEKRFLENQDYVRRNQKRVSCPCCRVWKKVSKKGGQDYFGEETKVRCPCCNQLRVTKVGVRKKPDSPNPGLKVVGRCTTMKPEERILLKSIKGTFMKLEETL